MLYFLLGSIWGSFGHVLASRRLSHKNFWWGRSTCTSCQHPLKFYHLLPIVSFLALKGRCGYCRKKIPMSVFHVEVLTGVLAMLCRIFFSPNVALLYFFWLWLALLLSLQDYWSQTIDAPLLIVGHLFLYLVNWQTASVPWQLSTLYLAMIMLSIMALFPQKIGSGDLLLLLLWSPMLHMKHFLWLILLGSLLALPFALHGKKISFVPFLSSSLCLILLSPALYDWWLFL
ncbi:prepilin peptidase [Enterococcus nangangensis]|uniref:prepilin peptidase n=1 Tax=Enterococcus nangangensis TaxID=2559926 RepID=UPI0010F7939B|nr:prepilin peptidase [Enterococcus nangangensis]